MSGTVEGCFCMDAQLMTFMEFGVRQTFCGEIDFADSRAVDRTQMLQDLSEILSDDLSDMLNNPPGDPDSPLPLNLAVSPAFEGEFTRGHMDQVEREWDGRYNTVLAIRFDGSVDDVVHEDDAAHDLDDLDRWREEWA